MTIRYLEPSEITAAKRKETWQHKCNVDGYGSRKFPSRYIVRTGDRYWRRVWHCQISNAGTTYLEIGNNWHIVETEVWDRIRALAD
jgi:hypothetical protein